MAHALHTLPNPAGLLLIIIITYSFAGDKLYTHIVMYES